MPRAKSILLGLCGAVVYGVLHDQITARLCLEYFSLAHPPIFPVHSLTALALCWGVASTFMVGLAFGCLLAVISQSPGLPPTPFPRLCRGALALLGTMAASATLAGLVGYALTRARIIAPPLELAGILPADRHARFMAVWFVHIGSYVAGFAGGAAWLGRLWRERGRPRLGVLRTLPSSRLGRLRLAALVGLILFILYVRFVRT